MSDIPGKPLDPTAKRPPHPLILLAFVLLLCLPPMTMVLGRMGGPRIMEGVSIASAEETWIHQRGASDTPRDDLAWLHPVLGNNPRVVKPPLVVWLNMLSWWDLDASSATGAQLIFRARLVAMVMTALTLIGIFCIGTTLQDEWLGLLAALITGTFWFVQREGRTDAYDIHMTAWATLTIAWVVWSMRPFDEFPTVRRRAIGWTMAGLFLGAGWMSKGPLTLLLVAVATGSLIGLAVREHCRHILGAVWMFALAAALTLPWYIYTLLRVPGSLDRMFHEYEAHRDQFQVWYYYIGVLGLVMPWTLWLVGGLVQPFTRAEGVERRRRLFAWLWFVILLILFSIPGAKQQRYMLPLMPAIGLVAAQVLRDHDTAAKLGRADPGSWLLYTPHWLGIFLASVLIAPLLLGQPWLIAHKYFSEPILGPVSWGFAVLLFLLTTPLACMGWLWHRRGHVIRAGVTSAVWMTVFSSFVWSSYAAMDRPDISAEPMRIAALFDNNRVFYLAPPNAKTKSINRQEEFVIFSRRLYTLVKPEDLQRNVVPEGAFLITEANPYQDKIMSDQGGFVKITDFECEGGDPFRVWRRKAAATRP